MKPDEENKQNEEVIFDRFHSDEPVAQPETMPIEQEDVFIERQEEKVPQPAQSEPEQPAAPGKESRAPVMPNAYKPLIYDPIPEDPLEDKRSEGAANMSPSSFFQPKFQRRSPPTSLPPAYAGANQPGPSYGSMVPNPNPVPNPAADQYNNQPPSNKRRLAAQIITIVVALSLLIFGGRFILNSFGGIALEKYQAEEYSILVPKDYEKKTEDSISTEFAEKTEESKTQSSILTGYEVFPPDADEELKQNILEFIEKSFQDEAKYSFTNVNELKDFKTEKTKVKGFDAIRGEGKSLDFDNKENGKLTAAIVVGEKGVYQILIFAHSSDSGLAKKMDKIIESLEIK